MTIKELKEKITDLPDDMLVGGYGNGGEFLDVIECSIETAPNPDIDCNLHPIQYEITYFCIDIASFYPE